MNNLPFTGGKPSGAWRLNDHCIINNSKMSFFIRMVHVDRYAK